MYLHNNIIIHVIILLNHVSEPISAVHVSTEKYNNTRGNTCNVHIVMFYLRTECNCTVAERTDIVFSCELIIDINRCFLNTRYTFIMIKFNADNWCVIVARSLPIPLYFSSTVTFPRQTHNCAKRHTRRQLTTPQRLPRQTHDICRFRGRRRGTRVYLFTHLAYYRRVYLLIDTHH